MNFFGLVHVKKNALATTNAQAYYERADPSWRRSLIALGWWCIAVHQDKSASS